MQYITQFRSLGMFALVLMLMASIITGCSDNTTDPGTPDVDPMAADASAEVSDPVTGAEGDSVRNNVRKHQADTNIIAIDSAITIVERENPGCEVLGVNVDYDRDTLTYECIIRENGRVYVCSVDPKTGKVKEKKEISNYYYTEVIIIRQVIRVNEARERSRQYVRGDVVEVNLETIEGRPTYVIVILTRDNKYVTIYIDAQTGSGRRVGNSDCSETVGHDDDDDDDDDNGHGKKKKKKHGRGHYRHGKGHGYGHEYRCHCECPEDEDPTSDTTTANIIKVDSARAIVQGYIDSSTVTDSRLDVRNDSTIFYVFKVKSQRDSNTYEFRINAFDGVFVEAKQTDGNLDSSEFTPPTIRRDSSTVDSLVTLSAARTAAKAQFPGTVTAWKLEFDTSEAKWVYTFEIQPASGEKKKVLVDAVTGAYIRTI